MEKKIEHLINCMDDLRVALWDLMDELRPVSAGPLRLVPLDEASDSVDDMVFPIIPGASEEAE